MIVVVMGVSGCGKSTVGAALSDALGWPLLDADDYHPPQNVVKMKAGVALTDDDRWPWLDRVVEALLRSASGPGAHAVLACSALKQAYRNRLARAGDVRFVHLRGDQPTIAERLAARQHRYMPASLLASQFATLEPPVDAVEIDIRASVAAQVQAICDALRLAAISAAHADPDARSEPGAKPHARSVETGDSR